VLSGADCAAVVTRHREYVDLAPGHVAAMRTPVIVDGRNAVDVQDASVNVRHLGKG
jgi:hypothetical protein